MREEARLREADDTDSHHIAVAKFMQKVVSLVNLCTPVPCCKSMLNSLSRVISLFIPSASGSKATVGEIS